MHHRRDFQGWHCRLIGGQNSLGIKRLATRDFICLLFQCFLWFGVLFKSSSWAYTIFFPPVFSLTLSCTIRDRECISSRCGPSFPRPFLLLSRFRRHWSPNLDFCFPSLFPTLMVKDLTCPPLPPLFFLFVSLGFFPRPFLPRFDTLLSYFRFPDFTSTDIPFVVLHLPPVKNLLPCRLTHFSAHWDLPSSYLLFLSLSFFSFHLPVVWCCQLFSLSP